MPSVSAAALLYGEAQSRRFGVEFLSDRTLLELAGRGQRLGVGGGQPPRSRGDAVRPRGGGRASGQRHSSRVAYHKGHYKNPLSDAEVEDKFRSLAVGPLTEAQADALLECLWRLDEASDLSELLRLARVEQAAA